MIYGNFDIPTYRTDVISYRSSKMIDNLHQSYFVVSMNTSKVSSVSLSSTVNL